MDKVQKGQIQVLPLVFVVLATTALAVNITMNQTSTGLVTGFADNQTRLLEATAQIELWAGTEIEISVVNSSIKALLLLDNGTALQDQELLFYINESFIGTAITDNEGTAVFDTNLTGTVKAVFPGDSALYLNPSSSITGEKDNITETRPEIKIGDIEFPSVVDILDEFEIRVFITSLHEDSTNVNFNLIYQNGFEILESPLKSVSVMNENESVIVTWRLKAILTGTHTLSVFAKNSEGSTDSIDLDIQIIRKDFVFILNKIARLGNLTITLVNVSESFYKTFDLDENYGRKEQKYYKVYIEVFNNFSRIPGIYTLEDNEFLDILLEDDLGNYYKQDNENLFFLDSVNLFGNSMEILPLNIRKGYLIFSETEGVPEKIIVKLKSGARAEFELR